MWRRVDHIDRWELRREPTAPSAPAGTSDAQPEDEANRVALALLAGNGFEGFIKQGSAELADVSTDGWDVVIKGLTSQEATDILIQIASNPRRSPTPA